jgi:hypothetical protein
VPGAGADCQNTCVFIEIFSSGFPAKITVRKNGARIFLDKPKQK